MADEIARKQQYEYKSNSNLVLQPDANLIDRRPRGEPTGEVLSLSGRLEGITMGDKSMKTKPPVARDFSTKRKGQEFSYSSSKRPGTIVDFTDDTTGIIYKPKSTETREIYKAILTCIQNCLDDQPREIMYAAADEILTVLKNDKLKDKEKRKEVELLLGPISDQRFSMFVTLSQKIVDWVNNDDEESDTNIDETIGINVQFEESEEEEDVEISNVVKEEDDSEDENSLPEVTLKRAAEIDTISVKKDSLHPRDIDAFWLQRKLHKYFTEPSLAQSKADEIIQILRDSSDDDVQGKLVLLLGHRQFDLIKILTDNRQMILYCTLYSSAQSEEEKMEIRQTMMKDPYLNGIFQSLSDTGTEDAINNEYINKVPQTRSESDKQLDVVDSAFNPADLINIDFNAITSSYFVNKKRCKLPEGSYKKSLAGYEEVYVPALIPKIQEEEQLIPISRLPNYAQPAFTNIKTLNRIQSKLFKVAIESEENILLCAPTGAGKTNVALMTILREIGKHVNEDTTINVDEFKIVYIAPMKSLVQEMVANFSSKLRPYSIKVDELTGDHQLTQEQIHSTQVIVCTPEKWDVITRKGGEKTFVNLVRLVIIDEIHLLHDERGPVLEAIIARTVRGIEKSGNNVRLIGLSATLPNYEDVAALLGVEKTGLFYFDNSYRPVPLQQVYIGINEKAARRYQLMNDIVYKKVVEHAASNQVLIFVHSRKETAKTARALKEMCLANDTLGVFLKESNKSIEILRTEAEHARNLDLKDLLPFGFAIHHAGMNKLDRALVEDLFSDRHIPVLVSTATLAWGVNLPAHTVIIKGTQVYSPEKSKWVELGCLDVMQMMGRAGRPQYDTRGVGILITNHTDMSYYLSLMNQQLPIESQLLHCLSDNLNAEIVLGSVQNLFDAAEWLKYTYLYIRMLKQPVLYGISLEDFEKDPTLEQRRLNLVHSAALVLEKSSLIVYDRKSGSFTSTNLGQIACDYYCKNETLSVFNQYLKPTLADIELFRVFSLASEFKRISVREEEKIELQKLVERVPIPIKESIEESSAKVNVLLQAYISNLNFDGFALMSDMVFITQSASRLVRAIFEIVMYRGWARLTHKALTLAKMIDQRMWSSMCPLKQFKKIPIEVVRKIDKRGFELHRLYDLSPEELTELLNIPRAGQVIIKYLRQFPKMELKVHILPITSSTLRIDLTITPYFKWDEKVHGNAQGFWIFIEDSDGVKLLHSEFFILRKKFAEAEHFLKFYVPVFTPRPPHYFVRIVSDKWIGSSTSLPVSFRHMTMPEKGNAPTELLDLQPLAISDLRNPNFESFYKQRYFNPIQTQIFNTAYNTDVSIFVGSPAGSGDNVIAEFAIFRLFSQNPNGRCVYVSPKSAQTPLIFDSLQNFHKILNKSVVLLTGDTPTDLKLLQNANIVVSTVENWDILSRRWKQRKVIQDVDLFVATHIELIDDEMGSVYESICTRMLYMSSQTQRPLRLVGLSIPLFNSEDVSQWLGCGINATFNFHPNIRPIVLHIQGYNINHYQTRFLSMLRPAYRSVVSYAKNKPAILFVSSRKQTRTTAFHLISYAAESDPTRFLHIGPNDDMQPFIDRLDDRNLAIVVEKGVAYIHEGLSTNDRQIVEQLFMHNIIQVVVASRNLVWGLNLCCSLVVVIDTQFYNGRYHSYEDYPIADLIQMTGLCSKYSSNGALGKVVICCQTSKKEYYKKFLYEPLPVESHFDQHFHDNLNSEIFAKIIETKQDVVDYLTWTLMYRRMARNPNYYNLSGSNHQVLSDHLSTLVESTLENLENVKCIAIEDDMNLSSLNLGIISSYYYICHNTIELFNISLSSKIKLKGLLEIISNAGEFVNLEIREGDEDILKQLAARLPNKIIDPDFTDPHVKTNLLIQSYLSRVQLSVEMQSDIVEIITKSIRLVQACVDVLSSSGWLSPALSAMELSQMIVQAVGSKESNLKQIPHFTAKMIEKCSEMSIESVFDVLELDSDKRISLLSCLTESERNDVARFCNAYPNVECEFAVSDEEIHTGSLVNVNVTLTREDDELVKVVAPFFPRKRDEGWWLVIGDPATNSLISIKRVTFVKTLNVRLDFVAPNEGNYEYYLYFMSDSYMGCDQEYTFSINVKE